jgi:NADH-quinone oxidoreductase subunit N
LAITATICLFSLAGIPLTGGFFAKYYVLMAAVEQGTMLWIVVFAVLMAAISVYYYFRVIMSMYFKQGEAELIEEATTIEKTLLIINAAIIIALGILPSVIMR